MISLITRPFRLLALIALVGVGVGGYVLWTGAHSSTAADQDGALADYRALGVTDTTARPGTPAPGVYRYRATGTERAGSGVVSAERPLPAEAVYIISPIAGGYHEDLRLSEEHVEEANYAVSGDAVNALWRRTKVTFLGVGTDDRSDVTPASIDHPVRFTVGRTWTGRYRLGNLAVTYTGRVGSKTTATVGGEKIPVYVMRTDSRYAGPTPGTRRDTILWSAEHSLPVVWKIEQKTGGAAEFAISGELRLESTTPAR